VNKLAPPSPELQRKIDNSKKVRKERKNLDAYHKAYPEHYLDSATLDKIELIKPWEFKTIIKQKRFESKNQLIQSTNSNLEVQEIYYAPTSPTPKVLVLCVDFEDEPATLPLSSIDERFNSTESLSLYRFFSDISLGKHVPRFGVHGWYRMPQTKAYYANDEYGRGNLGVVTLTTDALNLAATDSAINWCIFDNDGDTSIDYITIVTSGYSAETTGNINDLWSVAYGRKINIPNEYCNGYSITSNIFMRFSEYAIHYNPIGVYCHEYAHMLGAHDMYDTTGTTQGAGNWSLMDDGCYLNDGNTPCNIDAYNKELIGWATIGTNLTGYNSLSDSFSSDIIYKYTTPSIDEWFLIENRQQTSWDTYIPGSGLLIWHVTKKCKFYPPASYSAYLMQADGKDDLGSNKSNSGDSGDPYPGSTNNRSFNKTSNPSTLYCGSTTNYMNYEIINISDSAESIVFNVTSDITLCLQLTCAITIL